MTKNPHNIHFITSFLFKIFSKISFLILILSFNYGLANTSESNNTPIPSQNLKKLIDEALENNPNFKAMENLVKAKKSLIDPTGALPDPKMGFSFSNYPIDSFESDKTPMTGKVLNFSQPFPFPGKLSKKKEAAKFHYQSFKEGYTAKKLSLIAMVKKIYYAIYLDNKKIQITLENKKVLEEFVENTKTRYRIGKGLQQDVLKAQVSLSEIEKKLFTLSKMLKIHKTKLNQILGRDHTQDLASLLTINKLPKLTINIAKLDLEKLKSIALTNNPSLKQAQQQTKSIEKTKAFADMNFLPNFEVGFQYRIREKNMNDQGTDFISAFIGMKVPLYFSFKQSGMQKAALSQLSAQQSKQRALKLEMIQMFQSHYYSSVEAGQLIKLYRTKLIPQAEQALSSVEVGYEVNKVDFLMLLNAQKALFMHRIAYHKALVSLYNSLADLETVMGIPLEKVR